MTRNLEELMKTQIVDLSGDTVNRALLLNEELQSLRKQNTELTTANQQLTAERDGYLKTISCLEKGVNERQTHHDVSREVKLKEELKKMITSWDILYEELAELKAERDELRAKLEESEQERAAAPPAPAPGSTEEELRLKNELRQLKVQFDALYDDLAKVKAERDDLKTTLDEHYKASPPIMNDAAKESSAGSMFQLSRASSWRAPAASTSTDQASFLQQAFQRKSSLTAQSSSSNPTERKLQELEVENLKLKSTIVHLQTQMREEKYKNQLSHQQQDDRSVPTRSKSLMLSPSPRSSNNRSFSKRIPQDKNRREKENKADDYYNDLDAADVGGVPTLSPLGGDRSFRRISSMRSPPQRSTSLRRIHEYKARKDTTRQDHSSVATASTTDSSDPDTPVRMLGSSSSSSSMPRRSQSYHPSLSTPSPAADTRPTYGRSPSRDVHQATKLEQEQHAMPKHASNDDQNSLSSLSDGGNESAPKRSQSLIGRFWGGKE